MNSLRMAATIARRELRGGVNGFWVFLSCLALGVAAIAAINTVRVGIESGLEREGAALLGGDASIALTYRFANQDERAWMEKTALEVSEIADFRSMLVTKTEERALTQVKAVDDLYPLYGRILLDPQIPLDTALNQQNGYPGAVVDGILVDRLGLQLGDIVRLGTNDFILTARLDHAPDEVGGGFSRGPRTIVRMGDLTGSGLLSAGSLFDSEYRLRMPPTTDLDTLNAQAHEAISGAGFQWRDRRNGAPGIARFVERLSSFLVLVGLTGLAVGGVGIAAAVRAYLSEKVTTIATLRTLGADGRTIFLSYLLQIGALAILGIALGLILGSIVPLAIAPILERNLPVPAELSLRAGPLAQAALYGALSAALFTLWPLARSENVRAAALFRGDMDANASRPRVIWIIITGLILAALVGSAAYLSGLVKLTLWVCGGLFAAFIVLILSATILRRAAGALSRTAPLRRARTLRSALGAIGGPGGETIPVVLSLGLGLTVLAAVGQIEQNLNTSIARDLPEQAPSYFVVDIQNDQLAPLNDQWADNPAITQVQTAPMLRGVITKINDLPAADVAGDHWVLRGDRGLTYSAMPRPGTKITEGTWWDPDYTGAPQISFAAEEAEEMGLSLGDRLTVNVLGRNITATITSFREVDFSNAGIGFILTMNPAALAGAPHTHIATLHTDQNAEAAILRAMASTYPNITAIRVRDAIARVTTVLSSIATAITYGAMAALLTGGIVLIGTAAAGERARIYEGAILKSIGASRAVVLANFTLRSAILGLFAGLLATAGGIAAGWSVMTFVMEAEFEIALGSAFTIVFAGVFATLITGLMFAWRPLCAKPAQILRARE
ncbi:MAG: FtsX-like permease family protein [Litoreibacter sp.]